MTLIDHADAMAQIAEQEKRTGISLKLTTEIVNSFIDRAYEVIRRHRNGYREGVTDEDGDRFFLEPLYDALLAGANHNRRIFAKQFFLLNTSTIHLDEDSNVDYASSLDGVRLFQPVLTEHTGRLIDGTHRALKLRMMGRHLIHAFMVPKELIDAVPRISEDEDLLVIDMIR